MQSKTVYQTDQVGFLTGLAQADACQLEEGAWIIPGGCVEAKPPKCPVDKVPKWVDGKWWLIDNYVGRTAYRTDNGKPSTITGYGPVPEGMTLQQPENGQVWIDGEWVNDLGRLAAVTLVEINRACELAIVSGFSSSATGVRYVYASQFEDQLNLTGAILRGIDMPYACIDERGEKLFLRHTAAQLRKVGDDFTDFKMQLLQYANELKRNIDQAMAAGDVHALKTITWTAPV